MPLCVDRERRSNAGSRMAKLLNEEEEDELRVEVDMDKLSSFTHKQISAMQAAAEAVPENHGFAEMVEKYVKIAKDQLQS